MRCRSPWWPRAARGGWTICAGESPKAAPRRWPRAACSSSRGPTVPSCSRSPRGRRSRGCSRRPRRGHEDAWRSWLSVAEPLVRPLPTAAPGLERRTCVRCVMDTTDREIEFDESGSCNHCRRALDLLATKMPMYRDGEYSIDRIVPLIKKEGAGKPYDCILGVSGGTDSTYAAYVAKKHGLRPLAVHFDNGWNSELAVHNIEHVLRRLDIPLHTHVVDWHEFRDLQLAFLKASVPDAEIPTDHGIWALLYQTAARV